MSGQLSTMTTCNLMAFTSIRLGNIASVVERATEVSL
jgi:hypothetical protein